MNALRAYRNTATPPTERIDFILSHLRRVLAAYRQADEALETGDTLAAQRYLAMAQMILSGLAAGHSDPSDALAANFLRIYEFASHQASLASRPAIASALAALKPLLGAFEAVESEARRLERAGSIPPLGQQAMVQVTA